MAQRHQDEPVEEPNPEDQFEVPDDTAAFYCDSLHLNTGVWGTTLYLGETRPGQKPLLHARVKVSPQMLKAINLIAGKHIRDYVENVGPVSLPNSLVRQWGLEEEIQ